MTEDQVLYPWYSEEAGFFGPYYLKTYQDMLTDKTTKKEVFFLERTLKLTKGVKILDLCCGHGRHSIELARRGYCVTGQDLNTFFIREAASFATKAGVVVDWIQSDMRFIPRSNKFGAIINMFTAFGYLENDAEHISVLREIHRALKSGGRFVLDVINREWLIKNFQSLQATRFFDDSVELRERSLDFTDGCLLREDIIFADGTSGEKTKLKTSLRLYTLKELVAMGEAACLTFQAVYGGFSGEPYGLDAKRCIVLMQKK